MLNQQHVDNLQTLRAPPAACDRPGGSCVDPGGLAVLLSPCEPLCTIVRSTLLPPLPAPSVRSRPFRGAVFYVVPHCNCIPAAGCLPGQVQRGCTIGFLELVLTRRSPLLAEHCCPPPCRQRPSFVRSHPSCVLPWFAVLSPCSPWCLLQAACLAKCNGANVALHRSGTFSLEEFRRAVVETCTSGEEHLVVSWLAVWLVSCCRFCLRRALVRTPTDLVYLLVS
jgi:hypothetical protein